MSKDLDIAIDALRHLRLYREMYASGAGFQERLKATVALLRKVEEDRNKPGGLLSHLADGLEKGF